MCASLTPVRMERAPAPLLEGARNSFRKGAALSIHHEQLIALVRYQCCDLDYLTGLLLWH